MWLEPCRGNCAESKQEEADCYICSPKIFDQGKNKNLQLQQQPQSQSCQIVCTRGCSVQQQGSQWGEKGCTAFRWEKAIIWKNLREHCALTENELNEAPNSCSNDHCAASFFKKGAGSELSVLWTECYCPSQPTSLSIRCELMERHLQRMNKYAK